MSKRCLGCMESSANDFEICPLCGYAENSSAEEAIHMDPGSLLHDRYIIGRVLGYGGFGVTYIGWDGKLEQKVAIKEYLPGEFSTRMPGHTEVSVFSGEKSEQFNDGLKKFVDEAKRLVKFQNEPGIVKIFDSFEENGTAYIIMEYLDGETLTDYMKEKGTLSEDEAVDLLTPIMESLCSVHEKGIIHRDIAPDNIFITKTGDVKLIDFGASRYATTSHSRSLTVIIKQGFSPEEQYRSRGEQGPHTDVYAIAATLYKMITGVTPPDALERKTMFESRNRDILIEPHKIVKGISVNRENAILNAMNVRIEDRTPDVPTLLKELNSDPPAKRRYGRIKKIDLLTWPLWAKIAIPVLLAAVLTFGVLLLTGVVDFSRYSRNMTIPGNVVIAPDVEGLIKDEAISRIEENGLIAVTGGNIESQYIPAGTIILQDPVGGSFINRRGTVSLYISAGSGVIDIVDGMATVPYVIWDTEADAIAKLLSAGLGQPNIEYAYDDNVTAGQVISSSIEAGEKVPEGTSVAITISLGPEAFLMPEVTGMTEAEAKEALEQLGLVVSIEYENSSSAPSGTVIEQSVAANEEIHTGDPVTLTVSSGERLVAVPDVVGKSRSEAEALLRSAGFTIVVLENYSDSVAAGNVISQTPQGGSSQIEGSSVTIYISKGKAPVSVTGLSLDRSSLPLKTGESYTLTATVHPSNATNKNVTWQSSNSSVARVNSSGKVTGVSQGSATIIATSADGGFTAACVVSVTPNKISVISVSVSPRTLALTTGRSYTLTATVNPSNATDPSVRWSSSDTRVVTVSSSGRVTAVGAGRATVTVYTNDGNKQDSCTVTVTDSVVHVTGVTISRTTLTLNIGNTYTLTATVSPSNATDTSVQWFSSNTSVATVDSRGRVTAVREGTATITVKTNDGGYTAACSVTVPHQSVHPTGVTLDHTSLSMYVNNTVTLHATVIPANADNQNVTWSTSNTSVATVNSSGKVTAIALGSATITVTTVDGGHHAYCSVTVTRQSFVITFNPNGGSVSPTSATFYVGVPLGTLPTPTRTNYTFTGWFTSSSGGTQVTSSSVYNTASSFTVYAHWNASTVTVPNFSGQSLDTAIAWCNNNGIGYSTNYGYMWNYGNNIVVSNTNANSQVTVGSTITLNVSRGPKPIAVGDYVYVSGYCYSNSGNGAQGAYLDGYYYISNIYNYGVVAHPFLVGPNMGDATGWVAEESVHQRSGNAWGGHDISIRCCSDIVPGTCSLCLNESLPILRRRNSMPFVLPGRRQKNAD